MTMLQRIPRPSPRPTRARLEALLEQLYEDRDRAEAAARADRDRIAALIERAADAHQRRRAPRPPRRPRPRLRRRETHRRRTPRGGVRTAGRGERRCGGADVNVTNEAGRHAACRPASNHPRARRGAANARRYRQERSSTR